MINHFVKKISSIIVYIPSFLCLFLSYCFPFFYEFQFFLAQNMLEELLGIVGGLSQLLEHVPIAYLLKGNKASSLISKENIYKKKNGPYMDYLQSLPQGWPHYDNVRDIRHLIRYLLPTNVSILGVVAFKLIP